MINLFLSFLIAVGSAIGLVSLSHTLEMESYTNRIFPMIPLLYALAYNILERIRTKEKKPLYIDKMKEDVKTGAATIIRHITVGRVFTAVAISFCIKIIFEMYLLSLFLYFSNKSFIDIYDSFSIETLSKFLRGDHPWLMDNDGFYLLMLLALVTSFGTGLWIGYTAKAGPTAIFEGVLAGTVVTMVTALTNMLILYQKVEQMANQMAASMGYGMHIGFVAVLSLQVLLYGFWSGIAQKARQKRMAKKLLKRSKGSKANRG